MLFDSDQTFRVKVSDVDNTLDELTYDLFVGDQSIPAVFTLDTGENLNGSGSLAVDISQLTKGGLYALRSELMMVQVEALAYLRHGLFLIKQL